MFFGEYLVEKKIIDNETLLSALVTQVEQILAIRIYQLINWNLPKVPLLMEIKQSLTELRPVLLLIKLQQKLKPLMKVMLIQMHSLMRIIQSWQVYPLARTLLQLGFLRLILVTQPKPMLIQRFPI